MKIKNLVATLQSELDGAELSVREYVYNTYIRLPRAKDLRKTMTRKSHKKLMKKVRERVNRGEL